MVRIGTVGKARAVLAAAAVVMTGAAVAGCGADAGDGGGAASPTPTERKNGASIEVDRPVALADRAVGIEVTGLDPGARVTVRAAARDQRGQDWSAEGTYTADRKGVVDLARQAPRGGSPYRKPDSMGLVSAMLPRGGSAKKLVGSGKAFSYHSGAPAEHRSYGLRLTVTGAGGGEREGKRLAERTLERQWLGKGVTHRTLTVDKDKVDGELYAPPKGSPRRAPVLVFGGSEGGNAGEYAAALLASRGHPALSLCYFQCGKDSGRPDTLSDIDLDYFGRAARLLGKEPAADPDRLAVMGNSRGSEVAQLLGQRRPDLVHDVIAYAPSYKVNGPYLGGTVAWRDHGKAVPTGPIPLDRVRGTVLAIGGDNDKMWGSAYSAHRIAAQHNASGKPHKGVTYDGAGHHVNWFPYGQPGQEGGDNGEVVSTSVADQAARVDGWPRVLKLLGD